MHSLLSAVAVKRELDEEQPGQLGKLLMLQLLLFPTSSHLLPSGDMAVEQTFHAPPLLHQDLPSLPHHQEGPNPGIDLPPRAAVEHFPTVVPMWPGHYQTSDAAASTPHPALHQVVEAAPHPPKSTPVETYPLPILHSALQGGQTPGVCLFSFKSSIHRRNSKAETQ